MAKESVRVPGNPIHFFFKPDAQGLLLVFCGIGGHPNRPAIYGAASGEGPRRDKPVPRAKYLDVPGAIRHRHDGIACFFSQDDGSGLDYVPGSLGAVRYNPRGLVPLPELSD